MSADTGSIITVSGRSDPDELGTILPHEHVFLDGVSDSFELPNKPYEQRLARQDVSIELLGYLRRNPESNKDNLRLDSKEEAIEELSKFRQAGGQTVVDLTSKDAADPARVREVSRATGLNFVHGTSYYSVAGHPERIERMEIEELATEFAADVQTGIENTDVRAGIIGEIGLSGEIHEQEEKVLRAGARAALRTGAPLNIHPPLFGLEPSPKAALAALDIVEDVGLPLNRVVVSHMDQDHHAMQDLSDHVAIAKRGAYVEFDEWGGWDMYFERHQHAYPSDATRVDAVMELVERGYESKLLFSQDVCTKRQLVNYGGFGYAHVLKNVLPWLRNRGLSQDVLDRIVSENPKRVLAFEPPA